MEIELITCECGDWEVLKVEGKVFYEDHKIESDVWLELLSKIVGIKIKEKEVSDEDMENGNY